MTVKVFNFNPIQVNTYLLIDDKTNDAILIDPGCQSDEEKSWLKNYITSNKLNIKRVLNTHLHFDHIYGNRFIEETFGVGAEGGKEDIFFLNHYTDLLAMFGMPTDEEALPLKNTLTQGDIVQVGEIELEVRRVPGHSPGSLAFIAHKEGYAFVGDTLFEGSIGRTDLHRGNHATLIQSIREQLLTLPDETVVYSGHGNATTIGQEKERNPYLINL